jgi:hypothetical protein
MTSLFPPRESLVVTSRLGTGNSRTFFLRCVCCCHFHYFSMHPCFCCRPYCVGGPAVAFIPAVACLPAVVNGHDIAGILAVTCCWRYCKISTFLDPNGTCFASCHFRAQKSFDFQGPSLPMALEMDLPPSKSLCPARYR